MLHQNPHKNNNILKTKLKITLKAEDSKLHRLTEQDSMLAHYFALF